MRPALHAVLTTALAGLAMTAARADDDARLTKLRVLRDGYPRAFFFRQCESVAAQRAVEYASWERTFGRLMGIEGKALEEEVPGRSIRNIDVFTRFKARHPHQLVLLHYNGNARDPRSLEGRYFAGHWIYHNGARILSDVPAEGDETTIRVDRPELFQTDIGRFRDRREDVGLCRFDADGNPDWHRSEQVRVVAIDMRKKTIRVERGCYGTKPLAFPAGTGYAAAHLTEGPWGRRSHLLWMYNYSTRCPRDAQGRSCVDVHVDELAARFATSGELAAFDGLEFDVLFHTRSGGARRRGPDCDADGEIDGGIIDGLETYGIGVVDFCTRLREKLGDDRLMLADGHSSRSQRASRVLNGIESEGWPTLSDHAIGDWSGGLNRHFFWSYRGRAPAFNYINHMFITPGPQPGQTLRPDVPFSTHRLVFAAAVFTDAAICYSFPPPRVRGQRIAVWDELCMGRDKRLGWLGMPRGPARRLATRQPSTLRERRWEGRGCDARVGESSLRVSATNATKDRLRFRLHDVPCDGPELLVAVTASSQGPLPGFPPSVPRLLRVGIAPPAGIFTRPELPETTMHRRGEEERPLDPATGAAVGWVPRRRLGGEARNAYRTHPPYLDGTGATIWRRDARVEKGSVLELCTGMGERSPGRSDGVVFRVRVAVLEGDTVGPRETVLEHVQIASRWEEHRVSLSRLAGHTLRFEFVADCGPRDNSTTDHAYWGDVRVVGPEGVDALTPAVESMSWVDDREFTSYFAFTDIRSPRVDLEFQIEGIGPATIHAIAAHAAPDVTAREFEHGVVLANPSPRPHSLDIGALFPGRAFRRLSGTPEQDPTTNDGRRVGASVTLGPKDALFLVETEADSE